jgi:hypothetical protein
MRRPVTSDARVHLMSRLPAPRLAHHKVAPQTAKGPANDKGEHDS